MKENQPLVSIIIPVFEQLEYTKKCIQCIKKTIGGKINFEIIIVDDCSEDGTVEFLKNLSEKYRVFFNSEKRSYAQNNNFAAEKASGEYLCLLNNDVFVEANWLQPMLDAFKKREKVGLVGNVQKYHSSCIYDHMGVVFGPQGNPRHYGQWFRKIQFHGELRNWSAVTAACCVIRRETFLSLGGFNESFYNGCEDVDLCIRLNRRGLRNYVAHSSIVSHVKGASRGRKTYNEQNAELLKKLWQSEIMANESVTDQILHAKNYIYRGLIRPFSTNFFKWIEALLIYCRLKRLQ